MRHLRPHMAGALAAGVTLFTACSSTPPPSVEHISSSQTRVALAPPPPPADTAKTNGPLTCIDVVALAWAANGERIALEQEASAAYHEGKARNQPRNPEMRLGYGWGNAGSDRTYYTDPYWPFIQEYPRHTESSWQSSDATIRFFPRNPFVMYHTARQAAATERVAQHSVEVTRAFFSQRIAAMFVDQLFANQTLELAKKALDAASHAAAASARALEAGAIPLEEHARMQRRRLDAMSTQAQAQRDARQLSLAIAGALRTDPNEVKLAEDLDWLAGVGALPLARCLNVARTKRPDLLQIQEETGAARAQLAVERARLLPWVSFLEGSYGVDEGTDLVTGRKEVSSPPWEQLPEQQVYPGMATPLPRPTLPANISTDDDESSAWGIRLGVELPIFNIFSHADNAAKSHYLALLARKEELASRIDTEVRSLHADLQEAEEAHVSFQIQCMEAALPLAEALDAAREHGGLGELQIAQLHADALALALRRTGARRRLFQARLSLIAGLGLTPIDCEREILRALSARAADTPPAGKAN